VTPPAEYDSSKSSTEAGGARTSFFWAAASVAASLVALHGLFTTSRIFFFRDLALHFRPRSLWIRDELAAGRFPIWDPHMGYGQASIADPLNQLFFLPAYLRVLFDGVLGFNLWVALPFPFASVGTYLFLRRHASRAASALGAIAFSCSGPLLSTGNVPNFSWAAACIPWVLWAVDSLLERVSGRRVAMLALAVAIQAFAGEPVTLVATCILIAFYSLTRTFRKDTLRATLQRSAAVGASIFAGLLVAASYLVPLADAVRRSPRQAGFDTTLWALHPLRLAEIVAPALYGDYFRFEFDGQPLLPALNSNREPFLISVYLGASLLLLAVVGAVGWRDRRLARFWSAIFGLSLFWSLGGYTVVYRALVAVIPVVGSFRFPSKYTVFTALAGAICAAAGWDALADHATRRRVERVAAIGAGLALLAGIVAAWSLSAPSSAEATFAAVLASSGVPKVAEAATYLAANAPVVTLRLMLLLAVSALLLWLGSSRHTWASLARWGLVAFAAVDLLGAGMGLNPTAEAALFDKPQWVDVTRAHPEDRVYVGGRIPDLVSVKGSDPDSPPPTIGLRVGLPTVTAKIVELAKLAHYPSAWDVRESISIDIPALRDRDYYSTVRQFERSDPGSRTRFLQRTGVRYFLLPHPPATQNIDVAAVPTLFLTMYEGPAPSPRVAVVPEAEVEPNSENRARRFSDPAFEPARVVLLDDAPPEPAGTPSPDAAIASAAIVEESPTELSVRATVPTGGGYLVLYDSYDHQWRAEVDGLEAPILRANSLFRAVRVAPGEHVVRFTFRPISLVVGLAITCATMALLALLAFRWNPAPPESSGDAQIAVL
jgi:hypothetical protein